MYQATFWSVGRESEKQIRNSHLKSSRKAFFWHERKIVSKNQQNSERAVSLRSDLLWPLSPSSSKKKSTIIWNKWEFGRRIQISKVLNTNRTRNLLKMLCWLWLVSHETTQFVKTNKSKLLFNLMSDRHRRSFVSVVLCKEWKWLGIFDIFGHI